MGLLVSKTRALVAFGLLLFSDIRCEMLVHVMLAQYGETMFWSPPQLAIALSEALRVEAGAPIQNMFH